MLRQSYNNAKLLLRNNQLVKLYNFFNCNINLILMQFTLNLDASSLLQLNN